MPPEAWASEICTAVADWLDEVVALSEDFSENFDVSSGEAAKESMLGFLDDALATTDDMIQRVDAAGIPDVEDGEGAADHMMSALREVRAVIEDARGRIAALDGRPGGPRERVRSRGRRSTGVGNARIGAAFEDFEASEMNAIAMDSPACQQLPAA